MIYSYYKTENQIILQDPLLETIVDYIDKGYDVIYVEKGNSSEKIHITNLSACVIESIKNILAAINNYSDGFIVVFESEKTETEEDEGI